METVADGRLLGVALSPQNGEGTGQKEKTHDASFVETVSFVCYSVAGSEQHTSTLGRFHRAVCSYGRIWAQEQKLQWDPELNQPPLQWFASLSGSTGPGLLIQWRIFIILIEIFLIS